MARIAGVNIPDRKRIDIGLTYIYGIGHTRAARILEKADVEGAVKVGELSEEQGTAIRQIIQDEGRIEGDLRKEIQLNIKRLMDSGAIGVFDIAADCRSGASAPIRMLEPERDPRNRNPQTQEVTGNLSHG